MPAVSAIRRTVAAVVASGVGASFAAACHAAEHLLVLAQAQPPRVVPAGRNYVWEIIFVVIVSLLGLYAVCRSGRRQ